MKDYMRKFSIKICLYSDNYHRSKLLKINFFKFVITSKDNYEVARQVILRYKRKKFVKVELMARQWMLYCQMIRFKYKVNQANTKASTCPCEPLWCVHCFLCDDLVDYFLQEIYSWNITHARITYGSFKIKVKRLQKWYQWDFYFHLFHVYLPYIRMILILVVYIHRRLIILKYDGGQN